MGNKRSIFAVAFLFLFAVAARAGAHPLVENVLDIIAAPDSVTVEAHIAPEQVAVASANGAPTPDQVKAHAAYLQKHLQLSADHHPLAANSATLVDATSSLILYRFTYPLAAAPSTLELSHSFLQDHDGWTASCIVRFRQTDQAEFDTSLLLPDTAADFDCRWSAQTAPAAPMAVAGQTTRIHPWRTFWEYGRHGLLHILTGYDHLLFIAALVIAAGSLWDLVKVVTAFTLAHSLTLTLSVLNLVTLSERVVEPMIAASIVCVALQNVFFPSQSRGWTRLAIAFSFGLFHGLGFAGGLKEAMIGMPSTGLVAALLGFSLGVEAGHQIVVIPLYAFLGRFRQVRLEPRKPRFYMAIKPVASLAISVAGIYFLVRTVFIF